MTQDEARELIIRAVNDVISNDGVVGAAYVRALAEGWEVTELTLTVGMRAAAIAPDGVDAYWQGVGDEEFLRVMGIRGGTA